MFRSGVEWIKAGQEESARSIFQFPEVAEIGLGYTRQGKRGSGVGDFLSGLILKTLRESPAMLDRGVHHVEELQLISMGIGPDRVSDIAGSLLKKFLIDTLRSSVQFGKSRLPAAFPFSTFSIMKGKSGWTGILTCRSVR